MADFNIPGFNRRYVLLPMLTAIALVIGAFVATEARRNEVIETAAEIRDSQERMRMLAELIYAAAEAESGQRGYLLTRDRRYLEPYEDAAARIEVLVPEVRNAYRRHADELQHIDTAVTLVQNKLLELRATLALNDTDSQQGSAIQMVKSGVGLRWMTALRDEVEGIRNRERQKIYNDILLWQRQHNASRYIAVGGAVLNVMLLLLAGIYITRDIERRTAAANELDRLVARRTSELSELSTHLLQVTEREKSTLARELHDELGGLLVAIKMDLAQLAKQFDVTDPAVQPRWQRIQEALTAGVDLKRRVIEELRPTLLDNMGLMAALQWQAEQSCQQAGVTLQLSVPAEEPVLGNQEAIAIFRVVQESLTNMAKHAKATQLRLSVQVTNGELMLVMEDNGVGINSGPDDRTGTHGLASMKHRIRSIGGTFFVSNVDPHGTRIVVKVPLEIASAIASLG